MTTTDRDKLTGEDLHRLRQDAFRVTRKELAEELGVHPQTIMNREIRVMRRDRYDIYYGQHLAALRRIYNRRMAEALNGPQTI